MFLPLALLLIQDFSLERTSWEALARPWMTAEERALYDRLSTGDRKKFRGYFIARRVERPERWSETGLYLPHFYASRADGDVRDRLRFLLGEPRQTRPMPQKPELPRLWRYADHEFLFDLDGGKVKLAKASQPVWDGLMHDMVKHPEIRYDFRVHTFGRTRLPEDLAFIQAETASHHVEPRGEGGMVRVDIRIPRAFKDYAASQNINPVQHMEALFFLKRGRSEPRDNLPAERVRHAFHRLNLNQAEYLTFETAAPPGNWRAEILIYSGFMQTGLQAEADLLVLPAGLPRIGDPIVSQRWENAGLEAPESGAIPIGDYLYFSAREYKPHLPGRALVRSPYDDTRLWLRKDGRVRALGQLTRVGDWRLFALPPRIEGGQLLAVGFPPDGELAAVRARGLSPRLTDDQTARLAQANHPNYFSLDRLRLETDAPLSFLFVNGKALLGSKNGRFPWPSMDWGETARLRFELWRGEARAETRFQMKRNQVFEQISVQPQYLVAATQALDGAVKKVDFNVEVAGQPVKVLKTTPYQGIPKLWGLVVNDPLLKSPAWPRVRDAVADWLKASLGPRDLFYVVHISHRPEMALAPTAHKPLARAALDALQPKTRNENYFTVRYLLDALTHLGEHGARPHQVLMLTHRLTDETQQMENLIPMLRRTGLQLYNLEFPFEFTPESEEKLRERGDDGLEVMAAREEEDQREMGAARDNFQEVRNVKAGWRFRFKSKAQKRKEREEALREQAFRDAFNSQLAGLTAGMALTSGAGETVQNLTRFFERLGQWQEALVHVELATPYLEEDLVRVKTPAGYSASWTLVGWRPKEPKP